MKPALLTLALALAGCVAPTPATRSAAAPASSPARSALVGWWTMSKIIDQGTDVSAEHNPEGDRYIVLRSDGQFESGGQPYGRNTGRWSYDPVRAELALDSDAGPDDDSRWVVRLRGNTMEWTGVGSEFARRFRITARRVR